MRAYLASVSIFVAIAAAFALEIALGAVANDDALIALGALPDTDKLGGDYWRWMSFGFLHWDLTHLLLNSALLLAAGPIAERRAGLSWVLIVFFAASISSGVGISIKHFVWPSQGASVGASGGMFGLLGYALVLMYRFPPDRPIIRKALAAVAIVGFAYSLAPGISMVGHLIGFSVGVLTAFFFPRSDRGMLASVA